MLRTRVYGESSLSLHCIFSFVTQTQDNVSGFMPSLFVSIFCTFSCCIFCKGGERGVSCFSLSDPPTQAKVQPTLTRERARAKRCCARARAAPRTQRQRCSPCHAATCRRASRHRVEVIGEATAGRAEGDARGDAGALAVARPERERDDELVRRQRRREVDETSRRCPQPSHRLALSAQQS